MISNTDENLSHSMIGTLLVEAGIISQQDLDRALAIQREDMQRAGTPLGLSLVKQGIISETEFATLTHHSDFEKKIKSNLIENGWIDESEWGKCRQKIKPHEQVQDVLLREGSLTDKNFKTIWNRCLEGPFFGKLVLKLNMASESEIEKALKSHGTIRSVGEILWELRLVTIGELNFVVQKDNQHPRLGEILFLLDIIDKRMLEAALQEQGRTRESLGNILMRENIISADQLYFALSIQYNISFHELDDFVFDDKQRLELRDIIGKKNVEENMVLPLFLNGNNLTVALFNPAKKEIIEGLTDFLTPYRVTYILIRDDKFEQLFALLYGEILGSYRTVDDTLSAVCGSNGYLTISDPETESVRIDALYLEYEAMREKIGVAACDSRRSLFKEFIEKCYMDIHDQFHCKSINFYIDSRNDRVEILAAPLFKTVSHPED